jgi:hypothetical protein
MTTEPAAQPGLQKGPAHEPTLRASDKFGYQALEFINSPYLEPETWHEPELILITVHAAPAHRNGCTTTERDRRTNHRTPQGSVRVQRGIAVVALHGSLSIEIQMIASLCMCVSGEV